MKKLCLLLLLLAAPHKIYAQKLTTEQIKNFKKVALTMNNPLERKLIVRKWSTPIYYKVYGTESAEYDKTVAQEAANAFKQVKQLTGLEIHPVTADDSANFKIMIGTPEKLTGLLNADILSYFKKGGLFYYTTNHDGISGITSIINPKLYAERPHVRTIVQIQIANGLGLFGKLDYTENSLFSSRPTVLTINFKPEDALRIKTLYNKQLVHSMTEKEVDAVLKTIQ